MSRRKERWLARRAPAGPDITLRQRIIFILPTGQGALFALGALVLLGVAIAERNLHVLLLAVLMLSLFLLNLVLCYRNLSGLRLQSSGQQAGRCFAGEVAHFTFFLRAKGRRRAHRDLLIGFNETSMENVSLAAGTSRQITLGTEAHSRGFLVAPRLFLRTRYPAGLWQAWSRPDLAMRTLVYPRPQACVLPAALQLEPAVMQGQRLAARQSGVEDFVGLRDYQPGDSQRRIAWQSLARGQGLKTRQFVREARPPITLRFDHFPGLDSEQVLSCLCFQVLQLYRQGRDVGLSLPGGVYLAPGQSEAHKHRLLEALALWQ